MNKRVIDVNRLFLSHPVTGVNRKFGQVTALLAHWLWEAGIDTLADVIEGSGQE